MTGGRIGIECWGVFLPRHRLLRGGVERPLAGHDEDAVTLGVAAARDCLGQSEAPPDLVLFASTTAPYAEKQSAALVAAALGLPADTRCLDIAGTTRAGTDALLQACTAVNSGLARRALVVAAEVRMAPPGSVREARLADASVAMLIGPQPRAVLCSHHGLSESVMTVWRTPTDRFVRSWEERFVTLHGYYRPLREVMSEALAEGPVSRLALVAPDVRSHQRLVASLDVERGGVSNRILDQVGDCGAAQALLSLASTLEDASPGEELLLGDSGDGAAALRLHCLKPAGFRPLARALARPCQVVDVDWYHRVRELRVGEYPPAPGLGISATVHFREWREELALTGWQCCCGEHHFPRDRICRRCRALDTSTPVRYADRGGRLITYTHDAFFPSPQPSTTVGVVQVNEGARIYLQLADCDPEEVELDLAVNFSFRCMHRVGERPNYYWKAVPALGEEA